MLVLITVVILLCSVFPCHGTAETECVDLKRIARQASSRHISGFSMYCVANPACTGIDCNGNISMPMGTYTVRSQFCFGFEIQNCMKPTAVDFYSYVPKYPPFEERISHSDRRQLTSLRVDLGLVYLDPFLNITLEDRPNNHILIGLGLAMRLTSKYRFTPDHWPQRLRFNLIPPTEIPVQPCKTPSATLAPPVDNKCVGRPSDMPDTTTPGRTQPSEVPHVSTPHMTRPTAKPAITTHGMVQSSAKPDITTHGMTRSSAKPDITTPVPVHRTTTAKHVGPRPGKSPTYLKKCHPYDIQACSANEVCRQGTCQCSYQAKFEVASGLCKVRTPAKPQTTVQPTSASPHKGTHVPPAANASKSGSSHSTIVIAACTSAGVLLLAGIAIAVFFVIRKRRARYANHDILLQHDDDDDVELLT